MYSLLSLLSVLCMRVCLSIVSLSDSNGFFVVVEHVSIFEDGHCFIMFAISIV